MKSKILIRTFIILTIISFMSISTINNVSLTAAKDPFVFNDTSSQIKNKDENTLSYTGYDTSKIEQLIADFKAYIMDTYENVKSYMIDTKESITGSYDQIYDFFAN